MIKKIKSGLQRRKVKIFLVFLSCSFLIWLVSKLSETHTDRTSFILEYVNSPDSLLLANASKNKIDVRIRASGFQFLSYNFKNKVVRIDLSQVAKDGATYYISEQTYRKQIERQLPAAMTLLEIDSDTLFITFFSVLVKKVPVVPNINISLGQNYLMEDEITLKPDSITLRGPKNEIDSIRHIATVATALTELSGNFTNTIALHIPEALEYTTYSAKEVIVSGKVFRFSEKIIKVPIGVVNLPEGTEIKTFPNSMGVLCKAKIDRLKELDPSDFRITADYNAVRSNSQLLELELNNKPESIHSAELLENQVEFILKRE